MTKLKRHQKILQLIQDNNVDTQQQLLELLLNEGCDVTQATVSRDIKELRLQKTALPQGGYKYSAKQTDAGELAASLSDVFSKAIISVEYSFNLVVVKTYPGMAQAVCASLDTMTDVGILGTIAGEDTIFIATRSEAASSELVLMIKNKR